MQYTKDITIISQQNNTINKDTKKRNTINNELINMIFMNNMSISNEDINNMLNQNPDIIQLFNVYYPYLKFEQMDNELKRETIHKFIGDTLYNSNNLQENIINKNYELANKYIPEMSLPIELIYLNGKINNIPIKILFDTGATTNCIFKSKIIEAGLDYLVDKCCKSNIQGINSNNETYGKIWYAEIELEIESQNKEKKYTTVGLNLQIINDINSNLNINSNKFDVIFGLNFMKFYKTNIDFNSKTIILNNTIKIYF